MALVQQSITLLNDKFISIRGTSSVTRKKKRLVWEQITEKVNSLCVCPRSSKEIKTKSSNSYQTAINA